jgi:hypothetical protein
MEQLGEFDGMKQNGGWRIKRMENREWRMENGEWRSTIEAELKRSKTERRAKLDVVTLQLFSLTPILLPV